ncbi:hypothetical protein PRVXT_001428 [Proteinivorax tanatarense]|uniref:Uncharacterized protein n=1 Tax=Proteinivorax tanatarense TaxID=1260629 RepID=A0AAU7VQA6_9FIRM
MDKFLLGVGVGILSVYLILTLTSKPLFVNENDILTIAKSQGMLSKEEARQDLYDEIFIEIQEDFEKQLNNTYHKIKIQEGSSLSTITESLVNNKVISDSNEFEETVKDLDQTHNIKYGTFYLQNGLEYEKIIEILTN